MSPWDDPEIEAKNPRLNATKRMGGVLVEIFVGLANLVVFAFSAFLSFSILPMFGVVGLAQYGLAVLIAFFVVAALWTVFKIMSEFDF